MARSTSRPTAKAGPLQPRTAAIGNGTVQLEITLGDAELSLAELASIAVGDVISLDASPRDPISVRTSDGQAAFHAYLGRNTERKVIQVSGQ
jgi:flagellar motor switch protein FliM